jgi:hypothetical protein
MTFKQTWLGGLILVISSCSVLAEQDICRSIDQSIKIVQTKVIDGNLVIYVGPSALQKRRPNESDSTAAKKQLILAFNEYFRKKMSWNYLQIEARGEQFYIAKCSNLDSYVLQIPVENVKVTKLDKPKEGTAESNSIDNFSLNEFGQDNSFGDFK